MRPIEHGADIVVHSLTKFIGGHGNSIGGILVDGGTFDWSKSRQLSDAVAAAPGIWRHRPARDLRQFRLRHRRRVLGLRDIGPAISPFNAFLILTGLETLPLRMQRHVRQCAARSPTHLPTHPKVAWVNYAGLPGDKNNALQQKYSPQWRAAPCSPSA